LFRFRVHVERFVSQIVKPFIFGILPLQQHYIIVIDIVRNLRYDTDMHTVDAAIERYLREVLGAEPEISLWSDADKVPYFLQDTYSFRRCEINGLAMVLAIDHHQPRLPSRDLRVQLARIAAVAELPVVYVVNTLASHERRRLVEQRIPFIVPGNQLYLPMLGIDFREYFRQPPQPQNKPISPATQAILIAALMRKLWLTDWAPDTIANKLGYGPMTSSRAVQELTVSRIAVLVTRGRHRLLRIERPPAEVWEEAKPVLRSPVKRSVWIAIHTTSSHEFDPLPAGETALALYSMIGEPKWSTYAVGASLWNKAPRSRITVLPQPEDGASEWQIWNYSPRLGLEPQKTVDPLSLTLSLQDSPDERIRIALDELKEKFPWSKA
jgi:hypothetical protein